VLDIKSETSFDKLAAAGNFGAAGTLDVNLLGGYEPPVGAQFRFLSGGGGTLGEFETITPGFEELAEPNEDTILVSPRKPTAVTEAASDVTQTSAVLNGSVNPNTEQVTICEFEFGASAPHYGSSATCPTPPGKGPSPVAETEALTNLTPGTTYHFRIVAVNGDESEGVDRTFTTTAATVGGTKEPTPEKEPAPEREPATTGAGTTSLVSGITSGGSIAPTPAVAVATTSKAVEELLLGCGKRSLVLNDVLIRGGRVALNGSAAKSLVGKRVKIVFDAGKPVATATVQANGQFSTTAPLPPARLRDSNSARYIAESGSQRSLNLKLTRRLSLEEPRFSGGSVTLAGQVVPPLTKPIASVTVEQQLECGKASKVMTFTPPASGRFHVTIAGIPANAKAGIYRLTSVVAQSRGTAKHGFATFSLPLPVRLG
jgi:hypothetical protein